MRIFNLLGLIILSYLLNEIKSLHKIKERRGVYLPLGSLEAKSFKSPMLTKSEKERLFQIKENKTKEIAERVFSRVRRAYLFSFIYFCMRII